jgi:lysophospholipase L1-like esterase
MKSKKKIFIIVLLIMFILIIKLGDIILQKYGLGNVILHQNSIISGYTLKPNQIVKRKLNTIKINNLGMRSDNDWDDNKKDTKILFIGDSVTYGGSVVSNNELFTEKVCAKLNTNKSIYNCGNFSANGYSITSITNKIKYKKFDNEDLIIIILTANDLERNFHNAYSQPFFYSKIENIFPAYTELFSFFIDKIRHNLRYKNLSPSESYESKEFQKFTIDNVTNLATAAKINGKTILMIYSPEISEIKNTKKYIFYKNLLKKNFNNYLDMTDFIINKNNSSNIYYDHIHLNAVGHEFYSDIIKNYIITRFKI